MSKEEAISKILGVFPGIEHLFNREAIDPENLDDSIEKEISRCAKIIIYNK